MGQWYTATIKPPANKDIRAKVELLLDFKAGEGWYNWEHTLRSSPNYIWLQGNEYIESDLEDLLTNICEYLGIPKLEVSIRLDDETSVAAFNAQFHTINLITSDCFTSDIIFHRQDILQLYEERFGDKDEYIARLLYYITEFKGSSNSRSNYKIEQIAENKFRAIKI